MVTVRVVFGVSVAMDLATGRGVFSFIFLFRFLMTVLDTTEPQAVAHAAALASGDESTLPHAIHDADPSFVNVPPAVLQTRSRQAHLYEHHATVFLIHVQVGTDVVVLQEQLGVPVTHYLPHHTFLVTVPRTLLSF
jgi:hypothetical protein